MSVLNRLVTNLIVITIFVYQPCFSWEAEDYELFDIVEEVNKNFYEVLNVSQEASVGDIRKAYHKLSLKLHPDHNEDPDADTQFRQLVGIYDVLKDEKKRQKYDQVLKVGLPNWKNPLYYYRKVRKLGLLEMSAILGLIFTLGHYIILWSVYFEKKYEIEEVLSSKLRKRDKKLKRGKQINDNSLIEDKINELPKPSITNLIPFLIIGAIKSLIMNVPDIFEFLCIKLKDLKSKRSERGEGSESDSESSLNDVKKIKKKKVIEVPEFETSFDSSNVYTTNVIAADDSVTQDHEFLPETVKNCTNIWSEKDISALTKMMNRYPSGTSRRWEKIADDLQRNVKDVTEMVKSLRTKSEWKPASVELQGLTSNNLTNFSIQVSEVTVRDPLITVQALDSNDSLKNATTDLRTTNISESWNQYQQKALEQAIAKFPRGTTERWVKIAECIPEKSKEECMLRYKYIVDMVKLKRQK